VVFTGGNKVFILAFNIFVIVWPTYNKKKCGLNLTGDIAHKRGSTPSKFLTLYISPDENNGEIDTSKSKLKWGILEIRSTTLFKLSVF
jgi:uncharacterized protein YlbG (UPF0298 family)